MSYREFRLVRKGTSLVYQGQGSFLQAGTSRQKDETALE